MVCVAGWVSGERGGGLQAPPRDAAGCVRGRGDDVRPSSGGRWSAFLLRSRPARCHMSTFGSTMGDRGDYSSRGRRIPLRIPSAGQAAGAPLDNQKLPDSTGKFFETSIDVRRLMDLKVNLRARGQS